MNFGISYFLFFFQSCALPDDQEDKCSTICYPTIKPLLKHVGLCHQNNEVVYQLQDKIREQEIEIIF